jgi:hypothetical protein
MLILSPVLLLFQKNPFKFFRNIFSVLGGSKTWVGYVPNDGNQKGLPEIRQGILHPLDYLSADIADPLTISRLNSLYAKDYRIYTDLNILRKGWRNLGR